jgi:hypothetical protein
MKKEENEEQQEKEKNIISFEKEKEITLNTHKNTEDIINLKPQVNFDNEKNIQNDNENFIEEKNNYIYPLDIKKEKENKNICCSLLSENFCCIC